MSGAKHAPALVRLRITPTIANEYENRHPDYLPTEKLHAATWTLTLQEAHRVLADAEFNSDRNAQGVGPCGMPLGVFNAYAALARQARAAIRKTTGEGA